MVQFSLFGFLLGLLLGFFFGLLCLCCGLGLFVLGFLELLNKHLNESARESMQLFWLNLVVPVGINLSESCIDILVGQRSMNVVSCEEFCQELTELFAVQPIIAITIEL